MTSRQELERVYREHGHLVLRRARRMLGNEGDANDALHDVFRALLEQPEALAGVQSVVAYLYGVTTNLCLNRLRNRKTQRRLLEQHGEVLAPASGRLAIDLAAAGELLARLPLDQARAAIHHYCDGMTRDEIADALGCSRRQVGYLLERVATSVRASASVEASL